MKQTKKFRQHLGSISSPSPILPNAQPIALHVLNFEGNCKEVIIMVASVIPGHVLLSSQIPGRMFQFQQNSRTVVLDPAKVTSHWAQTNSFHTQYLSRTVFSYPKSVYNSRSRLGKGLLAVYQRTKVTVFFGSKRIYRNICPEISHLIGKLTSSETVYLTIRNDTPRRRFAIHNSKTSSRVT